MESVCWFDMKLQKVIIKMLCQRAGCDVTTPTGAVSLFYAIKESCPKDPLSINTIKRLVGILPYSGKPRVSTLDIIARYLGQPSWKQLNGVFLRPHSSAIGLNNPYRNPARIRKGAILVFEWQPNRKVSMLHRGKGIYDVIEAENSKLQVGDVVILGPIANGFPLVAHEVVRGGKSLGCLLAGQDDGVTYYCK